MPLSQEASRKLREHDWPGNVRELENAVHRAVLLARGDEITPESFSFVSRGGAQDESGSKADGDRGGFVGRTVSDVERELIIDTLHYCLGNRTHAANILGISIRTLRNKLKQYCEEGYAVPLPGEGGTSAA